MANCPKIDAEQVADTVIAAYRQVSTPSHHPVAAITIIMALDEQGGSPRFSSASLVSPCMDVKSYEDFGEELVRVIRAWARQQDGSALRL